VAAGRPELCLPVAAPWECSPESTDSLIPSANQRKKNTGRARSSPRPRWDPLLGPRDDENGSRRAAEDLALGEIQTVRGLASRAWFPCRGWKTTRGAVLGVK